MPSRKWLAARVTAVTGIAVMWATTGTWDVEETVAVITAVSSASLAYLIPNEEVTP